MGTFSPETDIYALGATLFHLLTGSRPPSASDVNEDGVPVAQLEAKGVGKHTIAAISKAMESRKKDRPKEVQTFVDMLQGKAPAGAYTILSRHNDTPSDPAPGQREEKTRLRQPQKQPDQPRVKSTPKPEKRWMWWTAGAVVLMALAVYMIVRPPKQSVEPNGPELSNQTFTVGGETFTMVEVEGGTFTMGATSEQGSDADNDEKPVHPVTLSSYYMGETEVTQALWEAVMGNNPSGFKGSNRPVEQVSWEDCQTFIRKLNSITGKHFRLPTEAEWEYAARGGGKSRGYKYAGGNNIGDVAWYYGNSGYETHSVKGKRPNELGLYDMSGNVWEWCSDGYGSYGSNAQTNPTGDNSGSYRVGRGGSWVNIARTCRVSFRGNDSPSFRYDALGLRLALSE